MRRRTKAREYALQLLYQIDMAHGELQATLQEFWSYHTAAQDVQEFATQLVEGAVAHAERIDQLITAYASNWEIGRMAVVDRNVLRLGAYELLYLQDVPPKVCLNEAVELAKRFGNEESSKFVNGILDTIHKQHARQAEVSPAEPTDAPLSP